MIGITLFASAYMAEVGPRRPAGHAARAVRGGGCARARLLEDDGLIVLPQALKISSPASSTPSSRCSRTRRLVAIIGLLRPDEHGADGKPLDPNWKSAIDCRGLCLRGAHLLDFLLLHVALLASASSAGSIPHRSERDQEKRFRNDQKAKVEPMHDRDRCSRQTRHRRSSRASAGRRDRIGVNKWFGDFHVLRDIDLTVGRGERIVICGPSGSGKSTLIRCINRLEEHQEGHDHRRRHRADQRPQEASTRCAAKSAWCSSSSTCSRI